MVRLREPAAAVLRPGRKVESDDATTQYVAVIAATVAVYAATGHLGLLLARTNPSVTTVWPPTGIAVAALLLGGLRLWPAVALGALAANLSNGSGPVTSLLVTVGDTAAPVAAALLLTRALRIRTDLDGVGDVLALLLLGGLGCMTLSATLGTAALVLGGTLPASQYWATWPAWWIGDSMGVVLVAPAILLGAAALRHRPALPRDRLAEAVAVIAGLVAVSLTPFLTHAPLSFLVFPPVLWAAFRFGKIGAIGSVLLTAGLGLAAAALGRGPYTGSLSPLAGLMALQAFNGSVALVAMVLAAVTEQAGRSRHALEELTADLETQVAIRTAELQASNEAKTEYLSRISHELRTPLTAIIGYSDLLGMDGPRPDQREKLQAVNRASEHLLSLINDVLDITSIETGTVGGTTEPVPVAEVVNEAANVLARLAEDRQIRIRVEPSAASAWVLADRTRLRQVVLNLVSNAIKYSVSGGSVRVAADPPGGDRVRVTVRDTGPGIAAELLPRLFTPFDRLGAERSAVPGSGLGLALCRRIIEAMGGAVGVDSQLGKGSTFWFDLPRAAPSPVATVTGRAQRRRRHRPPAGATILFVEDDPATRRMMSAIFERRPELRIISTDSGAAALDLVRREAPDAVLLDLHLPDLSGEEVLDRLRHDPETERLPVIVISADATTGTIARVRRAGVREYLTKPVRPRAVLEVLDSLAAEAALSSRR